MTSKEDHPGGTPPVTRKLAVFTLVALLVVFPSSSEIVEYSLIVKGVLFCGCPLIYDDKRLRVPALQEEKGIRAPNSQSFHCLFTGVRLAHAALFLILYFT